MNAELDATIGPILQIYAAQHGVIFRLRRRRAGHPDESCTAGSRDWASRPA